MRSALTFVAVLVVIAAVLVVVALRGGGDDEPYQVRAIFDNAGFVIPGEDVKIAGVKVGKIADTGVTADNKAAVVLDIEEPGFQDFRSDATCIVRPQSLIGEKFVECRPTEPKAPGATQAPPLKRIDQGPAEGQYLLPVDRTEKSVDLDLINNIYRRPYAERFSLILNEFGVGLAGRGDELNSVIKRSAPALKELDKVLVLLARQNRTLDRLATDADTVLAPLARERRAVTGFIERSSDVADATVERGADLEETLELLPPFLQQLSPTMQDLGAFAEAATPVATELNAAGPEISRFIEQLGPFATAGTPALQTLGDTAKAGVPQVEDTLPVARDLATTAKPLLAVAGELDALLTSLRKTGGVEEAMNFLFYSVAAINGFDQFGHYLRAGLLVNTCSSYKVTPTPGCESNFIEQDAADTAAASGQPRDSLLERISSVLAGADPDDLPAQTGDTGAVSRTTAGGGATAGAPSTPAVPKASAPAAPAPPATTPPAPADPAEPAAPAAPAAGEPTSAETSLLDYLFGEDAP